MCLFMNPLFAPQELINDFRHDQSPKQRNDTNCGVFTCLFPKQLLFLSSNLSGLSLNEDPRTEMAINL